MVATPVLAGAFLRVVLGALVDRFGARAVGIGAQIVVILGLVTTWLIAPHSYEYMFVLALVLGLAGASFAVALPLASSWYPPKYQGTALGIAGAGNSGTAVAALFAPGLAVLYGWLNVIGLAAIPLVIVLVIFIALAKDSPKRPPARPLSAWLPLLRQADCWWFMFFYSVTFGGFVGLAASLTIYFNDQYGLPPAMAGLCTALIVFAGSFVRPVGGVIADRVGGVRALVVFYAVAAIVFAIVAAGLPSIWLAMPVFILGMLALGMGNGAVFQLVPQHFSHAIGIMTGLVGMSGGVGGFYLASSLGAARQLTGSYGAGFLLFSLLAVAALLGILYCQRRWRVTSSVEEQVGEIGEVAGTA